MKKELWAARVNLSGLWSDKPMKVKFDAELNEYFEKSGDFGFHPGEILKFTEMSVDFASENKTETEAFIAGAKAVYHILGHISGK